MTLERMDVLAALVAAGGCFVSVSAAVGERALAGSLVIFALLCSVYVARLAELGADDRVVGGDVDGK